MASRAKLLIAAILLPVRLLAATFYVDFEAGSDSNPGTLASPFQRCPGDTEATGTAAATTLSPGDKVVFKGGVSYRGMVTFGWSGNFASPIVYDGNTEGTFGSGRAIMDGSVLITNSWTRCADAADCGGNTNFANIYYTSIPSGVSNGWPQLLMDGNTQTFTAQTPNPTNRYIFDLVPTWLSISTNASTTNSITSATYFSQADSSYWSGAWVGVWAQANSMKYRAVTNFIPASDTIQFATVNIYTDRDGYFALFNHVSLIDQAGEHAVSTNRLYLWPPDSTHPSNHVWSVGRYSNAFLGSGKHDVVIRGFTIRGYFHDVDAVGYGGCAIQFAGTGSTNLYVFDNDSRHLRSMDRDWLFTIPNADGRTVMSNTIAKSYGGGIFGGLARFAVMSNHLSELTGTAIYAPSSTNGLIASNYLNTVVGTHANGITLYTQCDGTVVSHNYVRNVYAPFTYQNSRNLTFMGNLVDAGGEDQRINSWGGNSGTFRWLNNSFLNNPAGYIMQIGADYSNVTHIVMNNLISGGGTWSGQVAVRSNNVYTVLADYQDAADGWSLINGETTNLVSVLLNDDWTPKAGSPVIDGGVDVSSYGYTRDLAGTAVGAAFNIGAYEGTNSPSGGGGGVSGATNTTSRKVFTRGGRI